MNPLPSDPVADYRPMMRDMPEHDRPRERLKQFGASALSEAELIAILLRVGVGGEHVLALSQRLLSELGGLSGLARAALSDLQRIKGIGLAKGAQLLAAIELGRRVMLAGPETRPQITSPEDAARLLGEMGFLEQEHMRVLLLDTKHRVMDALTLYKGSLNSSLVRVGEVFRDAIKQNCAAIILAHNHPSGDTSPSPQDIQVTEAVVEAGKLLDIKVLDHLIIGQQRFLSLREHGVRFE